MPTIPLTYVKPYPPIVRFCVGRGRRISTSETEWDTGPEEVVSLEREERMGRFKVQTGVGTPCKRFK